MLMIGVRQISLLVEHVVSMQGKTEVKTRLGLTAGTFLFMPAMIWAPGSDISSRHINQGHSPVCASCVLRTWWSSLTNNLHEAAFGAKWDSDHCCCTDYNMNRLLFTVFVFLRAWHIFQYPWSRHIIAPEATDETEDTSCCLCLIKTSAG